MNRPQRSDKSNGEQMPAIIDGFPVPLGLWAALNRDPDGFMALLWALDRLASRKRKPTLCYPGRCECPFCHPDYKRLTANT